MAEVGEPWTRVICPNCSWLGNLSETRGQYHHCPDCRSWDVHYYDPFNGAPIDTNGRALDTQQAVLYVRGIHGEGWGLKSRHYFALQDGRRTWRVGLKKVKPPALAAPSLGAFWAGFDIERRRDLADLR